MNDKIDIERCVWDLDYRRLVIDLLNSGTKERPVPANQNLKPAERRDGDKEKLPRAPART